MTSSLGCILGVVVDSAREAGVREATRFQLEEPNVNESFREDEDAVEERAALQGGVGR